MGKSGSNKNNVNESGDDIKYPGSPRSQKWIGNLLPVLERYNYNYAEIIQLVKSCDYNGDKIQDEVDRIIEINIGHEQGEWTVVKKPERVKQTSGTKTDKGVNVASRKGGNKINGTKESKPPRKLANVKGSAQLLANTEVVGAVPTAEKVTAPPAIQAHAHPAKEPHKVPKEKEQSTDVRKQVPHKDVAKEVPKQPPQTSGQKKAFPVQWASLLKSGPSEEKVVEQPAPPRQVRPADNTEGIAPKTTRKKKAAEPATDTKTKPESPKVKPDIEAIALAQAEETLKNLELVEPVKTEKPHPALVEVADEIPPVVMPKTLAPSIDPTLMFGCFEEDAHKSGAWPANSSLGHYQQPSQIRQSYGKYSRSSHQLRADPTVAPNLLHHEADAFVHHEVRAMHQEHVDTLHGDSSHMHDNAQETGFPAQWQMSYYGNRYSNSKHQPFSYAYEEDKHKQYRQGGNEHYGQKDSRHPINGVYFNYGYQPDRLQTPPGLVGFYTPQQPFYGFPNSTSQGNHPGASDSMTSSMWRN